MYRLFVCTKITLHIKLAVCICLSVYKLCNLVASFVLIFCYNVSDERSPRATSEELLKFPETFQTTLIEQSI